MGQVFVPLIQLPSHPHQRHAGRGVGGHNQLLPFCQAATESQLLIQLWFLFSDEGALFLRAKHS